MSIMDVILDTFQWAQLQSMFGVGRKLSEDEGLSGGAIAGIIIGVIFGLVCIGALVYLYLMPTTAKEKRAMGIGASLGGTYVFPIGANVIMMEEAPLRPLFNIFPSSAATNSRWILGLGVGFVVSLIAVISLASSLGQGGHGDAEGALVGVLVTFAVIAGLLAVALGLFVWNGMRKM